MYPFIYIFGRPIGTYGVCMVLGFFLAGFLAFRKGKSKGLIVPDVFIIGAMALIGAVIGGGVLYIFVTYSVDEIIALIQRGDFSFLNGGIVFYGGLIGGALGALLGIRIAGTSFELVEHSVIPFVPLGHAIGRIGCVMAGCCHGFGYDGPFALYYPHSVSGLSPDQGYFPVQPLESLINVGICLVLLRFEKRMKRTTSLLLLYLGLYSVSRFFLEMLRGDAVRGVWNGLSTSQIISIILLCVSVVGLLWKPRHEATS